MCPGFIQVSKDDPLSEPLPYAPEGKRNIALTIQQVTYIFYSIQICKIYDLHIIKEES